MLCWSGGQNHTDNTHHLRKSLIQADPIMKSIQVLNINIIYTKCNKKMAIAVKIFLELSFFGQKTNKKNPI